MAEKTVGQWIGTIVGAVVGFYTGGSTWYAMAGSMASGASVGSAVGGMLDPPKGPHLQGPRLNDLSVQSASYGAVIPRVYGTVALLGNVFWIENDQLKETASTSSQGGKGGGGGAEVTSYIYSATFAVGLCDGPIAGVRRIWVGSKLIYDNSATDISTIIASSQSSDLFTLYKGADTQLPDDRMQAALGVGNTPAFRGLAYIVFKDFPLADHGNSLLGAQVKVEVVKAGTAGGFSSLATSTLSNTQYAGSVFVVAYAYIEPHIVYAVPMNDVRTHPTPLMEIRRYNVFTGVIDTYRSINVTGAFWGAGIGKSDSMTFGGKDSNPCVVSYSVSQDATWNSYVEQYSIRDEYYYCFSANGGMLRYGVAGGLLTGRVVFSPTIAPNISTSGNMWGCETSDQYVYFCYYSIAGSHTIAKFNRKTLEFIENKTSLPAIAGISVIDDDEIYYSNAGNLYLTRDFFSTTVLIGASVSPFGTSYPWNVFKISKNIIAVTKQIYDVFSIQIFRLSGGITPTATLLSTIVQSEILTSNLLSPSDVDVTALSQSVRGYKIASVAASRAAIEPLQGAWPFDVLQSGYKIKFKPRGGSVVATIPASDLDARERSKAPGNALVIAREMDSIIPRRVVLKHMDVDREYDQGEQYAERLNTDAVNIQTVEMALAMTSTEAAGLAETLLYLYWLERYDISFSLPPTYNGLEPADVITINTADASYQLRLTSVAYTADGRLECSAKYNSAAIYTPTAIGESGQSTGVTLLPIGASAYDLLDIPLLLDAADLPGFPVAMTGYLAGWSGGSLFRTDDLGQTWSNLQSFTAPGAVMGSASATIGAGRLDLIDTASLLPVYLISGELSSVTEAQLLGGSNHFAYGVDGRWEIIGAQNCVLQGDGSYLLSNLLRGRFGSEWARGLHQSGDRVVLLDSNRVKFLTANLNTIGQARTYRAITAGKSLSSDSDKVFTYTGVNLECLAPVYLNGNRHPSTNDWALTWLRRTRVGGEWRDYVDATLGEASEAYEVEIYSSGAYTTLKRTISSLTTPAASYTSAQQVTDFGSNQATLYVKVYQLSANVGRGYPLTTSITR